MQLDAANITQNAAIKALCDEALKDLAEKSTSMRVAIVATMDGFPLASLNLDPTESRRVTAMSAAFSGLSSRIIKELQLPSLEGAVLESTEGLVLCRQINNQIMPLVLMVVTGADENYGFALLAVKRTSIHLGEMVDKLAGSAAPAVETI